MEVQMHTHTYILPMQIRVANFSNRSSGTLSHTPDHAKKGDFLPKLNLMTIVRERGGGKQCKTIQ